MNGCFQANILAVIETPPRLFNLTTDRKSTRLNSSHLVISYAVFCLKKTIEEFCEILTWSQLGLHAKPFGMLNVAGFYDHFLAFLDHAVARALIKPKHRQLLLTADEP